MKWQTVYPAGGLCICKHVFYVHTLYRQAASSVRTSWLVRVAFRDFVNTVLPKAVLWISKGLDLNRGIWCLFQFFRLRSSIYLIGRRPSLTMGLISELTCRRLNSKMLCSTSFTKHSRSGWAKCSCSDAVKPMFPSVLGIISNIEEFCNSNPVT